MINLLLSLNSNVKQSLAFTKRVNSISPRRTSRVCIDNGISITSRYATFPHDNDNDLESASASASLSFTDSLSGYKSPSVNWYPGHIAKAERLLSETLTSADLLLEVRDARIPRATAHPNVNKWIAGKPRIVVMTRLDMVPTAAVKSWKKGWDFSISSDGPARYDAIIKDSNILHQAQQARQQRQILDTAINTNKNTNSRPTKNTIEQLIYIDAKRGQGIPALHRAILNAGKHVNEKRIARGLRERPLRVAVLGFPNVGKSALINRILGRNRAKSANTPGVTRSLQWIRVSSSSSYESLSITDDMGRIKKSNKNDFELLDSPGIIPANLENQEDALLLAVCNCIGDAAYDNQGVAAYLCERLKTLHLMDKAHLTSPLWRDNFNKRYGFDPLEPTLLPSLSSSNFEAKKRIPTGEEMLIMIADRTCQGDPETAARKILQDFRSGRMGPMTLQLAPQSQDDTEGETLINVRRNVILRKGYELADEEISFDSDSIKEKAERERKERARLAIETAKERGLELPPTLDISSTSTDNEQDIGKGLFDGW